MGTGWVVRSLSLQVVGNEEDWWEQAGLLRVYNYKWLAVRTTGWVVRSLSLQVVGSEEDWWEQAGLL